MGTFKSVLQWTKRMKGLKPRKPGSGSYRRKGLWPKISIKMRVQRAAPRPGCPPLSGKNGEGIKWDFARANFDQGWQLQSLQNLNWKVSDVPRHILLSLSFSLSLSLTPSPLSLSLSDNVFYISSDLSFFPPTHMDVSSFVSCMFLLNISAFSTGSFSHLPTILSFSFSLLLFLFLS